MRCCVQCPWRVVYYVKLIDIRRSQACIAFSPLAQIVLANKFMDFEALRGTMLQSGFERFFVLVAQMQADFK